MYSYTVCREYNIEAFLDACSRLEAHFPDWEKEKLLIDPLDGDMVQVYENGGKRIKAENDFFVGAVYIDSDVCLDSLFGPSIKS